MARWVNQEYWAKDIEAEKAKEWRQWFWSEARSLSWNVAKGILQVGGVIGAFLGIIFWFVWIAGDGDQVRWLRVLTVIPVAGIVLGVFRWWDE